MLRPLVFFGVATLVGCVIRGFFWLRLRAAARHRGMREGGLCGLKQANRLSSLALVTSLVGLSAVGLAYLIFGLG